MNKEPKNNSNFCLPGEDYLYKTALPHAFITALEWSKVLEKGAWERTVRGGEEETRILKTFAYVLQEAYGIPCDADPKEIFAIIDAPLEKKRKGWLRKWKRMRRLEGGLF